MMDAYNAAKQFQENLNLFADAQANPEKYNLYAGLLNLTRALERIEQQNEQILLLLRSMQ